jgi:TP901 family phage tail tape measure protein
MSIAQLGYEIDSSQAVEAERNLDRMGEAAGRAEGSSDTLRSTVANLSKAMSSYGMASSDAATFVKSMASVSSKAGVDIGSLSDAVGQLAPKASQAGVSIDAITSALAGVQSSGQSVDQSVETVSSALSGLSSDSERASKDLDLLRIAAESVGASTSFDYQVDSSQAVEAQSQIQSLISETEKAIGKSRLDYQVDSSQAVEAERNLDRMDKASGRAEKGADRLDKRSQLLAASLRRVASVAGAVVGAITAMFGAGRAIQAARDFNSAIAETRTLIEGTQQEVNALTDAASRMAREFGGNATQQVQAFYQAISAGAGDVNQATVLLDQANRLAIGGVTGLTNAVDTLTLSTNAYAREGLTAADAADILFTGVRVGRTTMDELGASLGNVVPIASSMGISLDEVVGAAAALTTQGQSTAMAMTGLRGIMAAVIRPTKQASDMAEALGLEFSATALRAQGLQGFLRSVEDATGGNQEAMAQLFGSVEALNAVLAFTGGAGDKFNEAMDAMADRAGAADDAFGKVSEELSQRLNVQLAIIADVARRVGEVMLAVLVPAIEAVTGSWDFIVDVLRVVTTLTVAYAATHIPALVAAITAKVGALTLANAQLVIMNAQFIAGAIAARGMMVATRGLAAAMAFLGGPLGLVLGIMGGLTAAAVLFRDTTETMSPIIDDAKDAIDRINSVLAVSSEVMLPAAQRETLNLTNENIKLAKSAYAAAEAELAKAKAAAQYSQTELGLQQAFSPTGQHTQAIQDHETAIGRLTRAHSDLLIAQDGLTQRISDGQLALSSASDAIAENQRRAIELSVTMDDLANSIGGSGGSGGGSGAEDTGLLSRFEALQDELRSQAEQVELWYQEAQETLQWALENERLTLEEHAQMKLEIERLYQEQLAAIRGQANAQQLGDFASFMGEMAGIAQVGGDRMTRIARVFGGIQATINAYVAATAAMAQTPGSMWVRLGAYAKVLATGLGAVAAIRGGGSSGGGAAPSSASGVTQQQQPLRRTIVELRGPDWVKNIVQPLMEQIYEASEDGQVVFAR